MEIYEPSNEETPEMGHSPSTGWPPNPEEVQSVPGSDKKKKKKVNDSPRNRSIYLYTNIFRHKACDLLLGIEG